MRNSQRQEPAASSPAPMSGPAAAEIEMADPVRPPEKPSLRTGTDSRSIAMPLGITAAPTRAWPVRGRMRTEKSPGGADELWAVAEQEGERDPRRERRRH